jgi:hypothetical protein
MSDRAASILRDLDSVERLRAERLADPVLAHGVERVKAFQQLRFARTYADLLGSQRYARAARFFLDELYGPTDFSHRDAQFARVVPALVRLFPEDVVATVATLGQLHALSESLDSLMARTLSEFDGALDASRYAHAWRLVGEPLSRQSQIDLTVSVGRQLDRYTRSKLLRHSLRLMRGPAKAAGMEQLQRFLESGFDTFAEMRGAEEFLTIVRQREETLAAALFAGDDDILSQYVAH